jgi:DNA-binding response OmpR family regulator/predicted  nucleic acid-binding Zn-ribbon protein
MPKVLIFESDTRFADELKRGLEQQACAVTVVGDATEGLQLAANSRPDLILLTVELPRVNGFSVCNKLKRDPGLKSVPLIIMSSDSNEDTFSQHRRLKHSRAEDYVHKPIPFVDLLPRIRALVPLEDAPMNLHAMDEVVHIGEEGTATDSYVEIDPDSAEDTQFDTEIEAELQEVESIPPESGVDSEVDEFTEHAFDAMLDEEEALVARSVEDPDGEDPDTKVDATRSLLPALESARPNVLERPVSSVPVSPRPAHSQSPEFAVPRLSESEALAALDPRALAERDDAILELQELLAASQADQERLRAELAALAQRRIELEQRRAELERDLAAARESRHGSGPAPAAAGPSPQEFLALRETLNKKDKENLDLRGQVSAKSKELLAAKDTSLEFEREKAEAVDRVLQMERELHDLHREHGAAKADKEQAAKRAEDFKRRIEKLTGELQEKEQVLAGLREQVAAAEQAKQTELALAAERLEAAQAAAEQSKADALAEARERTDAALAAAEQGKQEQLAEARERMDGALAAAEQSKQEQLAEAVRRMDEALAAAEQSKQEQLAEARERMDGALAAAEQSKREALAEAARRMDEALAAAEQSKEEALAEASQDSEDLLARALETTRTASARELADAVQAERVSAAREQAAALEHQEARLRTEYEQALATLADDNAKAYRSLEAERDAALARAEHDISAARATTRELQNELGSARNDLAEARESLDATRATLGRESAKLATVQGELADAREQLEATRFELEHEQADLAAARSELGTRNEQLDSTRRELGSVQSELLTLRQDLESFQQEVAQGRQELASVRGEQAATERDLNAARQRISLLESELTENSAELAMARADTAQLQAEFTRVQATASAALSKWEQDRDAIHKGREALQAALEQLTQIESRPLN